MARSPVSFLKRHYSASRGYVYYIRKWIPSEKRYSVPKSASVLADELGIDIHEWPPSTKAGVKHIAALWLASNGSGNSQNNKFVWEYCLNFWDWEKSEYIQGKIAREQHIGRSYCRTSYKWVETYIKNRIPYLRLCQILASDLDNLQLRLKRETQLSSRTINNIMSALCTPLREAFRLGKIQYNPASRFRDLPDNNKRRGILKPKEVESLFSIPWESEQVKYAVKTTHMCGLRLGEILALSPDDIDIDFENKPVLWVKKSYSIEEGVKCTKTGNVRVVPISDELKNDLLELYAKNPYGNNFIFWGTESDKPISHKRIEGGFYRQLKKIGIDEKERKIRTVSYHSFRHAFNSSLRGAIHDSTLRLATGHEDPNMTDHYDHLTDERLAEIRKAQEDRIYMFKKV